MPDTATADFYAVGIVSLSACVPKDMEDAELERQANFAHPTGLDHGWKVSDEDFQNGPNPNPCEQDPSREHRLLHC